MVHLVAAAIIRKFNGLIAWPEDPECRRRIGQGLFGLSRPGIPNVCGAVDGSLIPILAPSVDEPQFVDRHGQHSINAMAVAGFVNQKLFKKRNIMKFQVQTCIFMPSIAVGQAAYTMPAYFSTVQFQRHLR
jgi:hypothetical protein